MLLYLSKLAVFAGIIALFGAQTATGQRCLSYAGQYGNFLFNVDNHKLVHVAPAEDGSFSNNDMFDMAVSPDRQHLVLIDHRVKDSRIIPDLPIKLSVKKFDTPIPFKQLYNPYERFLPGHEYLDLRWSPDSRWVVYLRTESDGTVYAGIADNTGKLLREVRLPLTYLVFDNWSSDSRYVALIQSPGEEESRVMYLSVPDLTPVVVKETVARVDCQGTFDTYPDPHCTFWSYTGHEAMYAIRSGTHSSLVLNDLDNGKVQAIDLGANSDEAGPIVFYPYWSPTDTNIAVVKITPGPDVNDTHPWLTTSLSVYGLDGTKRIDVDSVALEGLGNVDGEEPPELAWTPDGKRILYARDKILNPNADLKGNYTEIASYNVVNNSRQVLWRSDARRDMSIIPSPDSTRVAVLEDRRDSDFGTNVNLLSIDHGLIKMVGNYPLPILANWTPQSDLLVIAANAIDDDATASKLDVFKADGTSAFDKTYHYIDFEYSTWTPCDRP